MLREIRRVLVPGGTLLLTVPAYRWMWGLQDEVAHHKRRYVAPQVRSRLQEAGLEPRRLSYFNTLLFAPAAAIRLSRRLRLWPVRASSDLERGGAGIANSILARIFAFEAKLLARFDLPFGVSILALATKPRR